MSGLQQWLEKPITKDLLGGLVLGAIGGMGVVMFVIALVVLSP